MNTNIEAIDAAMAGPHIAIFTDGAAYRNPGPGGYGIVLCHMDGNYEVGRDLMGGISPESSTTNITMEMTAVAVALEAIEPGEPRPVVVRPDLELIVLGMTDWMPGWIARGWRTAGKKPVANAALWQRILDAAEGKNIHWLWVRGHAGDARNELAHQIADQHMRKAIGIGLFGNAA